MRLAGLQGRGRRSGPLLLALLLATVLSIGAPVYRHADAANEPLRVKATTTYVVDPDAKAVHVAIAMTVTNLRPSTASVIYYYRDITLAVQPAASGLRASDGSGSLRVTGTSLDGFVKAVVRLRANLYYKDSASFTVRYDLPSGSPRSDSTIRVGRAFASFGVWAWGDPGLGTVEVRLPAGFTSQVLGGPLTRASGGGPEVFTAAPADPFDFFAVITSENASAYASTRVSLTGGVEIVVLGWPEDATWQSQVRDVLKRGVPELQRLIGLPWPVEHDLSVRERYTPLLEGYAGVFLTSEERIDVSEDLDPMVTVHEASHAWFNGDLFDARWIYEGLADEYAARVLKALGEPVDAPKQPRVSDAGYQPLRAWEHPRVIRDQETGDTETYGYNAAWWVVRAIADAVGEDRMRAAFASARQNLIAYVGAGAPESVRPQDDWRRFLDLVEDPAQPDPAAIEDALRTLVLRPSEAGALADRQAARARYRELLASGGGWLPPYYVRRLLGEWQFRGANAAMDEATAVLALRDQVATQAEALGLRPDGRLEAAYESAHADFGEATGLAHGELDALAALADARAKLDAPQGLVAQLGLLGETPRTDYDAAAAAFEAGDTTAAIDRAALAAAVIAAAPAVGEQRLLAAVAVALIVLLLLALTVLALRRRRRRGRPAFADFSATPGPYATLAADPEAVPPAQEPAAPEAEGGTASGASTAEP